MRTTIMNRKKRNHEDDDHILIVNSLKQKPYKKNNNAMMQMNMRENRCLGDLESSDKNGGNHTFIVRISDRSTNKNL